jgi:ribonucleoside-diphosphate reductase subunit M2
METFMKMHEMRQEKVAGTAANSGTTSNGGSRKKRDHAEQSGEDTDGETVGAGKGRSGVNGTSTAEKDEPLLREDDRRYVMFPIRDPEIWKMAKNQVDNFWRAEEVFKDIHVDIEQWKSKLSENDRRYLSMTLAFFAASDGLVMENLGVRFMQDVQLAEARYFYGFQIAMENIHSETYSLLIDSLITDPVEKHGLFNAMEKFPCIQRKAAWAKKWINDRRSGFASRLVAFACVEGVFFSSSFASIFWVKKRGLMPALTTSNEFISRDESLHTDFAVLLYSKLTNKLPRKRVVDIVRDAAEIEKEFAADALQCSLIGMNEKQMKEYIEFVADRLCIQLGYQKIYGTKNPFDWMEAISMKHKTNFFEHAVTQYSMPDMSVTANDLSNSEVDIFSMDTGF